MVSPDFWRRRRVLLTGHTGFKGCWTRVVLERLGAKVTGLSLAADTPSLHGLLGGGDDAAVDIRDRAAVRAAVDAAEPEVILHLAAQALVRASFDRPFETMETNIAGSLNLLEAVHAGGGDPAILMITSDKVYRNRNTGQFFTEDDALDGEDPYSASKAACEIAVHAAARACRLRVATARAGNVIGGGDFAADRLIPDIVRAVQSQSGLKLRHPEATRPWQHVLDIIFGYLIYAERLGQPGLPPALNFGPGAEGLTVREVITLMEAALGQTVPWQVVPSDDKPERTRLELDVALSRSVLGFDNALSQDDAIRWAGDWYRRYLTGEPATRVTHDQLDTYIKDYRRG
ncbi:CDP-glucose 4,6-dehydratase [Asticcacaulis biprosthecium C19]|uniref:CDP-glucose 4,6-dehydratase n=1 Tax=Asticcacaulis biprosthecium C19 TaxID=715226 RepID=F4QRQ8_9CAUL|nr:CDP-glucose 4,6-dehydratase [Asticcacaulis biprosthecium]EGF89428.1 CDP-glucose 4,6-dehydratase [Asticcacaulis biprosthecium C19]